ncbi:lysophospholipid acyltransferase 5 [Anthonomus grandis grandis]|uniref:lysophospholipid acyltransferase 5 n=1 Tax=Anthonomus grandis grandis TaxID=2921223 RepID=UPI0021669A01|nr:lysophospholipid acyltransferase 5 [Anthonomus grandis grandis]XP_050313538.1 lysophospholipid acyltransferase 5 [Anthonomus grandis grandis]XP_050313547.1 lysophospholipid acyltransferase 5 [Anthonomus grandis grandis]
MSEEVQAGLVGLVSQAVGISEPALRLVVGVLAGYPLALIYRKFLYNQNEQIQCLYFFLSGLSLGLFNYGYGMFHCLFAILFTYLSIVILQATPLMVTVVFVFNFIYLLTGYYYSSTDSYDITWTMPYCILVLRLIGVAFDVWDGSRPVNKLSSDSQKTALAQPPTLLQMLAHSLFPSAFLVGPQFSMRRFLDFISGKFHGKGSNGEILAPDSVRAAIMRGAMGVIYMSVFQLLGLWVHDDLIISDEFAKLSFVKRMFWLGVFGRYSLYKYISVWLLTEGACILFGLSYNEDKDGETNWNGVENIKLTTFENATEFNHYIIAFNVNTNLWVSQHIYKRLKFLGNKYYSQGGVLLFLAIWHGLHSGYYFTFLHEFIVIYMERDLQSIIKSNQTLREIFSNPIAKILLMVVLRIYTFVGMGWSVLPFVYLQYPKYLKAFHNCSYSGFIIWYLWPIIYAPLLRMAFKKTKSANEIK